MVPILNALNVQCAVYGNHDFGLDAAFIVFLQCLLSTTLMVLVEQSLLSIKCVSFYVCVDSNF